MKKSFTSLFLLIGISFTCLAQTTFSAVDDEKEIRRLLKEWTANYNKGDLKKSFEIWAPDLIGWYPGLKTDLTFKESTEIPTSEYPKATFELEINEVIIEGNMAVVRDTWQESIQYAKEEDIKLITLRSFEVWKRQTDGKWKIIRWIDSL